MVRSRCLGPCVGPWSGSAGWRLSQPPPGSSSPNGWAYHPTPDAGPTRLLAWALALALPVGVAAALRGAGALPMAPIAAWVVIGPWLIHQRGVAPYLWAAGLAGLLLWWGLRDRRSTPVNLAMAGFALTVLVFYFFYLIGRPGRV